MGLRERVSHDHGMPKKGGCQYAPEPTLQGHCVIIVALPMGHTAIVPMPSNRGAPPGSALDVKP
jgi:hypothetical protein